MESNAIFVKFHTQLPSTDFFVVLVLVVVPRPLLSSDFEDEHEDEYEKNQIKSHAYALRLNLKPYTLYLPPCSGHPTPETSNRVT